MHLGAYEPVDQVLNVIALGGPVALAMLLVSRARCAGGRCHCGRWCAVAELKDVHGGDTSAIWSIDSVHLEHI